MIDLETSEQRERYRATQRAAFADALRRLADLYERDVLPMPLSPLSVSLNFREEQDGRERAAVAAEALGVDWTPEPSVGGSPSYLLARAKLRPAPIDLSMLLHLAERGDEPVPPPPAVALVAELNAAARGEREPGAGCSCGARFAPDDLDDHLAVCPLEDDGPAEATR